VKLLKIPLKEDERRTEEGDDISRERRFTAMTGLTYLRKGLYQRSRKGAAQSAWRNSFGGFTVIELLIVVVILAIAALTAIPMMSSAASMQIRSAANLIMADLEYAKSMAITRGQNYSVVFDVAADSYQIEDQDNNVISHPVKKGFPYIVRFPNESRLNRVNVTNVDFSDATVTFDCLGSPNSGGMVSLQAGDMTATVTVEPVTGFISSQ
jgi:prepilin-type N-terminal cleavage/methylation domain-containing protein